MDNDFSKEAYAEKPIVLSPPSVSGSATSGPFQSQLGSNAMSGMPVNYHSRQNQSVGYNLQQEFETLKADLDLDLSLANDISASSYKMGYCGDDNQQPILLRSDQSTGGSGLTSEINFSSPMSGPNSAVDHASVGAGTGAGHNFKTRAGPALLSGSSYPMNSSLLDNLAREGMALGKNASSFLPHLSAPARPQSVNDFSHSLGSHHGVQLHLHQNGFIADMMQITSWVESLNTHDMVTVIDYWCNNLPFDILLAIKCKFENHLGDNQMRAQLGNQIGNQVQGLQNVLSNTGFSQDYSNSDFSSEPRMASSDLGQSGGRSIGSSNSYNSGVDSNGTDSAQSLLQPKPKANGNFPTHLFADSKVQRPKLADPAVNGRLVNGGGPAINGLDGFLGQAFPSPGMRGASGQLAVDRARSPTAHLCEKTNFLQLAAGQSPLSFGPSSDDTLDSSAALKLGALATINSRVVLDSSRKNYAQASAVLRGGTSSFDESLNRQTHSSSVPVDVQKYSTVLMTGRKKESDSPGKKMGNGPTLGDGLPSVINQANSQSGASSAQTVSLAASSLTSLAGTSMPNEIASLELLNNIPAWLKLLRLHKYTDCLRNIYWKDLVSLSDQELEDRGVRALGARRKLLKAFETVRLARTRTF